MTPPANPTENASDNFVYRDTVELCPDCGGAGRHEEMITEDYARAWKCSTCNGEGEMEFEIEELAAPFAPMEVS